MSTFHKDIAMKLLLPLTASLILGVLIHGDVWGQDSSAPPPEMKALERLVGTWKVEQENKVPEQARLTYVLKGQSILGGRFVQQMGSPHDGTKPTQMGMYTYDSSEKNYRYWFFMSSGFFTDITGTWDESSQTFTFSDWLPRRGGATINVHFTDKTTYVFSMTTKDAGGKVVYQMEGQAVRQK
jgi:hypothetical protein